MAYSGSVTLGLGYIAWPQDGAGGILLLGGSRDVGQHVPTLHIYRYDIDRNSWVTATGSSPRPI